MEKKQFGENFKAPLLFIFSKLKRVFDLWMKLLFEAQKEIEKNNQDEV